MSVGRSSPFMLLPHNLPTVGKLALQRGRCCKLPSTDTNLMLPSLKHHLSTYKSIIPSHFLTLYPLPMVAFIITAEVVDFSTPRRASLYSYKSYACSIFCDDALVNVHIYHSNFLSQASHVSAFLHNPLFQRFTSVLPFYQTSTPYYITNNHHATYSKDTLTFQSSNIPTSFNRRYKHVYISRAFF
jgi:hypothetical protein